MGHEISFLSARTIKIWSLPVAMGFSIPYDLMVKNERNKFYPRFAHYAAETK